MSFSLRYFWAYGLTPSVLLHALLEPPQLLRERREPRLPALLRVYFQACPLALPGEVAACPKRSRQMAATRYCARA
jgi:hypothetical protein